MEKEQRIAEKERPAIAQQKRPHYKKEAWPSDGNSKKSLKRVKYVGSIEERRKKMKAFLDARREGRIKSAEHKITTDVIDRASEIIGSEEKALRWMGTPIRALDFATPISLLGTKKGGALVNRVLGQMEHGIW